MGFLQVTTGEILHFKWFLTRRNRVFRPPPAAQSLISRNPDLISPKSPIFLISRNYSLFPVDIGGYPPQGGGVHVFGKAIGFNLVPGNKAYGGEGVSWLFPLQVTVGIGAFS